VSNLVSALITWACIGAAVLAVAGGWLWITSIQPGPSPRGRRPKHARPAAYVASCPACGSRDEYTRPDPPEHTCGHLADGGEGPSFWREDWTDDELDQLAGRKPIEFGPPARWSLAEQMKTQDMWLAARRREADLVTDDLVRGRLADPWWTRRQ
jgi:hypothetical protein